MKIHYLKTVQPFFSEVKKGTKTFEHRINDRDFQVGDEVILQEYDLTTYSFSGQEIKGTITYVLTKRAGLGDDFCVFSFETTQQITKNVKEEEEKVFDNAKVFDNEEKVKIEFEKACKPLMRYLSENWHPHVTCLVTGTNAELLSGEIVYQNNDFIVD